jgi:hypothetical protein
LTAADLPAEARDSPAPPQRGSRFRAVLAVVGPVAILGVLAYLLVTHWHEIATAGKRLSFGQLVLVTALAFVTLVARTEAVVACLAAMGSRPRRRDIHAANSLTFLAATVNHYVSSIVRAALVKRLDRERAPTIPQMIMVDASTTLIEGLLVLVLIIVSAGTLNLDWWLPVLALLAGICALASALFARRRFARLQLLRGLDVLAHSSQRLRVSALMVAVIVCQVVRTLIVLRAVGLNPSLLQAVATFVAAGAISSLLAGPGAGTAGAPLLVFGHQSVGASAAAGLILSITAILAGAVYAVLGGPVFMWRLRRATP